MADRKFDFTVWDASTLGAGGFLDTPVILLRGDRTRAEKQHRPSCPQPQGISVASRGMMVQDTNLLAPMNGLPDA